MGCFWSPDALLGAQQGVVRTRVGYAGGRKSSPTYRDMGDHTETIQIEYDPERIDYSELLYLFRDNHDPSAPSSTQYRSMIFYHDDEQKKLAEEAKIKYTIIVQYSRFYFAEDYHQKYRLSTNRSLYKAFRSIYTETKDFVDSTVVARVNGYVSGYGEIATGDDLKVLGLNSIGREKVYGIWTRASSTSFR